MLGKRDKEESSLLSITCPPVSGVGFPSSPAPPAPLGSGTIQLRRIVFMEPVSRRLRIPERKKNLN